MTVEEYYAALRGMGLTIVREIKETNAVLFIDRDKQIHHVPNGNSLDNDEREALVALMRMRIGA